MKYTATKEWLAIIEKSGYIQNLSSIRKIEISTSQDEDGLELLPGEKIEFRIKTLENLFCRTKTGAAEFRVVDCLSAEFDAHELLANVQDVAFMYSNGDKPHRNITTAIGVENGLLRYATTELGTKPTGAGKIVNIGGGIYKVVAEDE